MSFYLGPRSRLRLSGVNSDLVAVVKLAIKLTKVDFTVLEGLRSVKRQEQLVASGASRTMNSRHITGHAVDLAPYIKGRVSWHWDNYWEMANAVLVAAERLEVPVTWGAAWGRTLTDYESAEDANASYLDDKRKMNRKPFMDGVHFELDRRVYGPGDTRGSPKVQCLLKEYLDAAKS